MKQPKDIKEKTIEVSSKEQREKAPLNETWSQDAQDELEDFIEQQGIYIRQ
ncbi:MAG: hypothetical protein HFH48_06290 [Lachnospiraceae bacterium]|nr:hypothetical protein [Lachnospiraceae bacterium]